MKKSIRLLWAAVFVCLSTGVLGAQSTGAKAEADMKDVPGSATMPPKTKNESHPQKPEKSGAVKLGVWIGVEGKVEEVEFLDGKDSWKAACIEAAKKLQFEPVVWKEVAYPARTEISYSFDGRNVLMMATPLPNLPGEVHTEEEWGLTKPILEEDPNVALPLIIRSRRMLNIEAGVNYLITADGRTENIDLWGASSEGAVRVALDSISERRYKPARIRETPVIMKYKQVFSFQTLDAPIEALAGAVDIADPAYPYELLLAKDEGHAVVKFTLNGDGKVESSVLLEASHPEFGGALLAAVDSWTFNPESILTAGAVREYRHDFLLASMSQAARRLIVAARAGEAISNSAAGLDAKAKVLSSAGLLYPSALKDQKVAGVAAVEFIIDRVGLVQLPRALKASKPEFGWAAVTAVNSMRFAPLTRKGKPTELRVVMPVNFSPPKTEQAAETKTPASGG